MAIGFDEDTVLKAVVISTDMESMTLEHQFAVLAEGEKPKVAKLRQLVEDAGAS